MAIFGNDGRLLVENTAVYPFSTITSIVSTFPDGTRAIGSGSLVGRNDVLTAAHVVYSPEHGGHATRVSVTPGRSGEAEPFGAHDAVATHVHPGYIAGDTGEDLAMITLADDVGESTGWLGWTALPSAADYQGLFVESAGYPADWVSGSGWPGQLMSYTSGTIDLANEDTLFFTSWAGPYYDEDLDAWPGQSGSPVVLTEQNNLWVLGVVSYQSTNSIGEGYNAAASLHDDALRVRQWIDYEPPGTQTLSATAPAYVLEIVRLYEAGLDRPFDREGLNFWIDRFEDALLPLETLAAGFLDSPEFTTRYGDADAMAPAEFVSRMYLNVLDRPPEAEGDAYWQQRMAEGATQEQILVAFATSDENVARTGYLSDLREVSPGTWDIA